MICESCGNTYDDNLTVCPVCGVSAAQSLAKPDLQTVTQTVPPFVRKPGTEPEAKTEASSTLETDTVIENTSSGSTGSESEMLANAHSQDKHINYSSVNVSKKKTNAATSVGLVLGIITVVLSLIPYSYFFFVSVIPFILFIIPLLGIILSIIGLLTKQGKNVPKAVAGIILSVVGSVILLVGYYFYFLPAYKQFLNILDGWKSHVDAWSPNGLANTGYSFEVDNELDFSYGDYEILSLNVDSYQIDL